MGGDLKTTAKVLVGIVALMLLMACANIANLLLARGIGRTPEMALRAALGASRARLVRQLVGESVLMAAIGGGAGVAFAAALLRAAPSIMPPDTLPQGIVLALDVRVTLFAIAAALGAGVLFGLVPAWHATDVSLAATMVSRGRTATARTGRLRAAWQSRKWRSRSSCSPVPDCSCGPCCPSSASMPAITNAA